MPTSATAAAAAPQQRSHKNPSHAHKKVELEKPQVLVPGRGHHRRRPLLVFLALRRGTGSCEQSWEESQGQGAAESVSRAQGAGLGSEWDGRGHQAVRWGLEREEDLRQFALQGRVLRLGRRAG